MISATPTIKRRLIVMVYESLLVFGIVFFASLVFDIATQSRHALKLRHARQFWLFLVLGAYFTYSWCRSGQTLAMKTWRIRLVSADGGPVPPFRAAIRYVLAWLWFVPAFAAADLLGLKQWLCVALVAGGIALSATLGRLSKERQFLHDRLAGTRIVSLPAPAAA